MSEKMLRPHFISFTQPGISRLALSPRHSRSRGYYCAEGRLAIKRKMAPDGSGKMTDIEGAYMQCHRNATPNQHSH